MYHVFSWQLQALKRVTTFTGLDGGKEHIIFSHAIRENLSDQVQQGPRRPPTLCSWDLFEADGKVDREYMSSSVGFMWKVGITLPLWDLIYLGSSVVCDVL